MTQPDDDVVTLNPESKRLGNLITARVAVVDLPDWIMTLWRKRLEQTGFRIDFQWFSTLGQLSEWLQGTPDEPPHLLLLHGRAQPYFGCSLRESGPALELIRELLEQPGGWFQRRIHAFDTNRTDLLAFEELGVTLQSRWDVAGNLADLIQAALVPRDDPAAAH